MQLWMACLLLLADAIGVVLLCRTMRGKERKGGYIAGVAGLAIIAIAAAVYIIMTLFLVGSVVS